jgi:hypothetical protein
MMLIVVPSKRVDFLLRILQRLKPVDVEALFAEAPVEGLDRRGLPRRLKSRITALVYAQRSIAALTNSVPLSQ